MNDLIKFSNQLLCNDIDFDSIHIVNEFDRQKVDKKYFDLDILFGRISFRTPYGYFHDFIQKTIMNSDKNMCMEESTYSLYVHFTIGDKKGTIVFDEPKIISCNNYGRNEGHHLLLQASKKDLLIKKGWL